MNVLVTGPDQTPYEKGFFHFFMRMPHNYPIQPPRVKFLTTGAGVVRFNPNLYANGKVCLSILGYVKLKRILREVMYQSQHTNTLRI